MNTPRLLDDHPAGLSEDRLQFKRYLRPLMQQLLALPVSAPFSLGIYGPPGAGKSSLLRMLAQTLAHSGQRAVSCDFRVTPGPALPVLLDGLAQADQRFAGLAPSGLATALANLDNRLILLLDHLDHGTLGEIAERLAVLQRFFQQAPCLCVFTADPARLKHALQNSADLRIERVAQLAFELPPHSSRDLLAMLGAEASAERAYLMRVAELFAHSPQQLKQLWNQAVLGLSVLQAELERARGFYHEPSLALMLKWLLLRNRGRLRGNPYLYLGLEARAARQGMDSLQEALCALLELPPEQTGFERHLSVFLWHDLLRHRFGSPRVFSLYAGHGSGESSRSRLFIEECRFAGDTCLEYHDFSWAGLSNGYFSGMRFVECDFSHANLQDAELRDTVFERCRLAGARFDRADLKHSRFVACDDLAGLDTLPDTYEQIADCAAQSWLEQPIDGWNPESLYKVYKSILNRHGDSLTEAVRQRLLRKGMRIRQHLLAPTSPESISYV